MTAASRPWRVVWSGDATCKSLADLMADTRAVRVGNNLRDALVDARATLHVTRNLPSAEHCSVAVPHGVVIDEVTAVTAAVGGGPHSLLAAAAAQRIARSLNVPASVLTGYRRSDSKDGADAVLGDIAAAGIELPMHAVATDRPVEVISNQPCGTLVVLGASGGSWFQRQFFGPGARLQAGAPAGVVVVRESMRRVYQVMGPPRAIGHHLRVRDALELTSEPVVLVAEHGRLSGLVSRADLETAPPHITVESLVQPFGGVGAEEPVEEVLELLQEHRGGPLGVTDRQGRLIGVLSSDHVAAHSGAAAVVAS